jgi:O-acetyl-ADP-ribose deacetylase (regulator of RNase III)
MARPEIKNLYYITHIDNVPSIVQHGILAHAEVERKRVQFTPIYDKSIVASRGAKRVPDGRTLWEFANLYFQARNPMMYRVVQEKHKESLAVVAVRQNILDYPSIIITDGNAANGPTQFYSADAGLTVLQQQWKVIQNDWWRPDDGSKRKIMSECLVPSQVPPEYIDTIYVATQTTAEELRNRCVSSSTPVIAEPKVFFQPQHASRIGRKISLIHGDMFFSNMQTLTVSVNTKGIMGKGLASRAKYQFPDVYVEYQDACRARHLTATRPFLYKRERSLDEELADLSTPLNTQNSVKWFLLFATKRHWRDNSRVEDIEAGMQWVLDHYDSEGIRSLAMPALGCGLGGLDWKDIGPLMCSYLGKMHIESAIYLPRETDIPQQYLEEAFLLGS